MLLFQQSKIQKRETLKRTPAKGGQMKEKKEKVRPQRAYKDTVFRVLFREKENLLSLYNAVNGTAYSDVENLEITTLENAVYMNYKNDISFVMNFEYLYFSIMECSISRSRRH